MRFDRKRTEISRIRHFANLRDAAATEWSYRVKPGRNIPGLSLHDRTIQMAIWHRKHRPSRRSYEREAKFLRGRIILPQSDMSLYVTVLNFTEHGAMVKQTYGCALPGNLTLETYEPEFLLPTKHLCAVRWQRGNLVGLEFPEKTFGECRRPQTK